MMQNKEKMSQTPHNRQFPPLGSAKSKLNDRKQVKAAHTRKMHEIQNHLQTGLISPEQLNDLIKNLKQLYQECEKAHQLLVKAHDYVVHPEKDDNQWLADVKAAQEELIAAANRYEPRSGKRTTRKQLANAAAAGAASSVSATFQQFRMDNYRSLNSNQTTTVEVHHEDAIQVDQADVSEPDESQSDEDEQRDEENSVHSTTSHNSNHFTTPPEQSTNIQQTALAGRPQQGASATDSLLGGLTFADLTRKFHKKAVSDSGFRPSFGGGGGRNGSDSSVSSRTKRQLAEEQHKRAVIEQLLDQLQDEAAAYRERATMEKLNSQMQIHELAVALNNNANELKIKMEAEKAEKEKHQQEIKRLQDSIDGIKHSSKEECEALMQQMNSRLRDIESKYKADEAEEEKDEEVELLDVFVNEVDASSERERKIDWGNSEEFKDWMAIIFTTVASEGND